MKRLIIVCGFLASSYGYAKAQQSEELPPCYAVATGGCQILTNGTGVPFVIVYHAVIVRKDYSVKHIDGLTHPDCDADIDAAKKLDDHKNPIIFSGCIPQ